LNKQLSYTLKELPELIKIGIRDNLVTSKSSDKWFPDAVTDCLESIQNNGNPLLSSFYKNMNIDKLKTHVNTASDLKNTKKWDSDEQTFDIVMDEGKVHYSKFLEYGKNITVMQPYKKYMKFNKYQSYFNSKNRLSDLCTLNSTGPVGVKFTKDSVQDISICYANTFEDNDITCITAIIEVGKNATINLEEYFENKKDSIKMYNLIYLIKDGSKVVINRKYDLEQKDNSANIVESRIIQFPNSNFTLNVTGEGSKHTQDIVDVEVYNDCFTSILGSFNCFDNVTNNMVVDMHHKGHNSFSRVDVKSIVDDSAHSSFLGKITVDKEAEGVDAELFNKNLLLSNKATAITEPQLDINTKEINCKHGCTVSNIDKDELYYLESRGIETTWAEETLKKCFLTI